MPYENVCEVEGAYCKYNDSVTGFCLVRYRVYTISL